MICLIFSMMSLLIFARVISSWLPRPNSQIGVTAIGALERVTDVVLKPIRNTLPALRLGNMGLDLSPIIVIVIIGILTRAFC